MIKPAGEPVFGATVVHASTVIHFQGSKEKGQPKLPLIDAVIQPLA
jgi:hypothetical protein